MNAPFLIRNGALTPSCASPMLIQYLGSRQMSVMNDVPHDISAMGVALFELIISAEAFWKQKQDPFMFEPRPKDLKACTNGEWLSRGSKAAG